MMKTKKNRIIRKKEKKKKKNFGESFDCQKVSGNKQKQIIGTVSNYPD